MDLPVNSILNKYFFQGDKIMKFDVIVGNPPYNESDKSDGKGSAKPLYNLFVNLSRELKPDFITLITPSVWFLGGKGLSSFRKSMLSDKHLNFFGNYITSKDIFPGVNLRGGVNYFLWSSNYSNHVNGLCVNEYQNNKLISSSKREITIEGLDLFISDNVGFKIIKRLIEQKQIEVNYENSDKGLAKFVSERNPFGLSTTFNKFEDLDNKCSQYKVFRSGGKIGYINSNLLKKGQNLIGRIKVITPFANNIGTDLPDDNLNTIIAGSHEITTETFLVIGGELELTYKTAHYLEKYLKTKFVRYLIGLAKANQNGTRQTYRFVPKPDLLGNEINWTQSIDAINERLYEIYMLNDHERNFIESKIKQMN